MRDTDFVAVVAVASALTLACTTDSSSGEHGNGGTWSTGGSPNAGGAAGSGGSQQSGGARPSGGTGAAGSGGNGGAAATGGARSSGGSPSSSGGVNDSGAGGDDGGDASPDAGSIRCTGPKLSFPAFDRTCSTVADCVVVRHQTSCCGSALFMGLNRGDLGPFQAAEGICDAQYPLCGCASQGADAEDGTLLPWGKESQIVVSCDKHTCRTHYSGETFACGPKTCTDQQLCREFSGGAAGSPPSYDCPQLDSCKSCTCMNPNASPGCTCTEKQGLMTISCAAP